MRSVCYCFGLVGSLIFAASLATATDDAIALQYAKDAVATLEQDFERLQDASSEGTISSTVWQLREDELHDARLLLLRLQGDTDGATGVLRAAVDRRKEQLQRVENMAERGFVGTNQVSDARLRVLAARLTLANHTNDQEMKNSAVQAAVSIEEEKLKSIINLASKGYTSRAAIAVQKLRIARIIATKELAIP